MKKSNEQEFSSALFKLAKEHNVDISSVEKIQEFLKKGFKDLLEGALEAEFDTHMGYDKNAPTKANNYRNGYGHKQVKSSFGEFTINPPRDREASFEPKIVPKRQRNISELEEKIINMYGMGTSTRDIVRTIHEIYGFDLDPSYISKITDKILPGIEAWKERALKKIYPFVFIDGMRFEVRNDGAGREVTCYIIIGVNLDGKKEFIGYWIGETESAKHWMAIFNEIKARGVERILIISADNLTGISKAIKAIYPETTIQKCVIHQIRNAVRFVSHKDLKAFTQDMKRIYQAKTLAGAKSALARFSDTWSSKYKFAVQSWQKNFDELTSFFDFPVEIRKMIYTTNIIENVNGQIRRVTKTKGSFTNLKSLEKLIYLKLIRIEKKWTVPVQNWGIILNQLYIKYDLNAYLK